MSSPTVLLQSAVDATRHALDAGKINRLRASRRVARHCRAALRHYPYDAELGLAVSHVASRGFVPPPRAELPEGSDAELWCTLTGHLDHELASLAASFVAWPEPADQPEAARRLLMLFLLVPSERDRAAALLDALAPHCDTETVALWRFRHDASKLDATATCDPDAWTALIAPLRALNSEEGSALSVALTLAASALISHATCHGAEWMQPVLGGQLVLNRHLALRRRPALRDELAPAIAWLEEAETLARPQSNTLLDILDGGDAADANGDFITGTAQLEAAVAMAADREDLALSLAARAAALGDGVLMARAVAMGAHALPFTARPDALEPPVVSAPSGDTESWSQRIEALASPGTVPERVEDLLFLERAGSRHRAALGWLARRSSSDLLQATRLADALGADGNAQLTAALQDTLPEDELALGPEQEALALALYPRLTDAAQRTIWALRLGAVAHVDGGTTTAESSPSPEPQASTEDPHSVESRLAAARELIDSEHWAPGSAIIAALLRHDEATDAHDGVVTLTVAALRQEEPAPALVNATARVILGTKEPGPALLARLTTDAMAAYAMHETLHRGALDRRRPEHHRVRLLEAWLGIWAATQTAPDPAGLQALMHIDPVLLPLAACRLGQELDPVARAAAFIAEYPPLETTSAEYGQALLDLATASNPMATA